MFSSKMFARRCPIRSSMCKQFTQQATFDTPGYKLFKLDKGPESKGTVTRDEALDMFTKMYTIRRMEAACANLYKEKLIRGFCHLYSGQEAIAVGIKSLISDKDTVITSYRAHGWTYLMGMSPFQIIAELVGKKSGVVRGKGGSMHMYAKNFYGGNGIVGAQVPLGTGLAFMHQYNKTGGVSVTCYGDGASNQGQVFESFNIAKLLNLPAIYVIENNRYGMGTSTKRSSSNTDYYTRGDYIPGFWVDGMDVISVREGFRFAKQFIAEGNGPILVEMYTYRYFGHSMSDPGTSYRSREEVKQVRETIDPINTFRKKAVAVKLVSEEELDKIDKDVKKQIDDAVAKSKSDKQIDESELYSDVYSVNLEGKIRSVAHDKPADHILIGKPANL